MQLLVETFALLNTESPHRLFHTEIKLIIEVAIPCGPWSFHKLARRDPRLCEHGGKFRQPTGRPKWSFTWVGLT